MGEYIDYTCLGSGSYGKIYGISKDIAIKQYNSTPLSSDFIREISSLSLLHNVPYVVKMLEYNPVKMEMKMERSDTTLYDLILKRDKKMSVISMKRFMLQIVTAIRNINNHNVYHRDLKPNNILIKNNNIQICDFGISRVYTREDFEMTEETYSIWYRPPEVLIANLFGISTNHKYILKSEVYAMGRVFLDMLIGLENNILQGDNTQEQLILNMFTFDSANFKFDIFDVDANKNVNISYEDIVIKIKENGSSKNDNILMLPTGNKLKERICRRLEFVDDAICDLINDMLHPDPNMRPNCSDILTHVYFKEVFDNVDTMESHISKRNGSYIPLIDHVNKKRITKHIYTTVLKWVFEVSEKFELRGYVCTMICCLLRHQMANISNLSVKNLQLFASSCIYIVTQLMSIIPYTLKEIFRMCGKNIFTIEEFHCNIETVLLSIHNIDLYVIVKDLENASDSCPGVNMFRLFNTLDVSGLTFDQSYDNILDICKNLYKLKTLKIYRTIPENTKEILNKICEMSLDAT